MQTFAYKARKLVTFANEAPARGSDLFAPVDIIDNGMIITGADRILAVGTNLNHDGAITDLGDVIVLPALVNAHSHLQLSWLKNKTLWGMGFGAWLASLIPQILKTINSGFGALQQAALAEACNGLAATGTKFIADTGGSLPGALEIVHAAYQKAGLAGPRFCEWFGYGQWDSIWPPRCRSAVESSSQLYPVCAPAGHALYSTSPQIMRGASDWCRRNGRIFSFHLAESPEETEFLCSGHGPLRDLYQKNVLPKNWQAPGLAPLAYAQSLGIMGPHTLAVHGTQLSRKEIGQFASTGSSLCLCPRSNFNLTSGSPRTHDMMSAGILLCLGTDGLTSCEDLDVRNEARFLNETQDIPMQALWRMATINGAHALNLEPIAARLVPGAPACFSIWPD